MHTRIEMSATTKHVRPLARPVAEVVVEHVTIAGPHEPFVTDVSFTAPPREVTVVPSDPGHPQAALALAIGGRMDGVSGTIEVGGVSDRRVLQSLVRLVDVEDVSAPDDALPLRTVIGEELALADQSASRADVRSFLAQRGLGHLAGHRWDRVPAPTRLALLTEFGAWRPGTRVVVITGPDRHGVDPAAWLAPAQDVAAHGLTVIVLCTPATAAQGMTRASTTSVPASPDRAAAETILEDVHA